MTAMPAMRDIVNDTLADATDVDFNFKTIQTHVGTELINRDGSVSMTGHLLLTAGNPVTPLGAAPKQYVDAALAAVMPPGVITPYAGAAAPSGWLLADGAVIAQASYPELFAIIGATYNTGGEGAGNFRLPNLKTRVPVGRDAATAPFTTLGASGGSKDAINVSHSHTSPAHAHADSGHFHTGPSHQHDLGSHTHTGSTGTSSGSFDSGYLVFAFPSSGTQPLSIQTGTSYGMSYNLPGQVNLNSGSHSHTVSINAAVGNTGSAGTGNTGTSVTGLSSTAVTVDASGSSGTNANLTPYLIVNYIIKT